MSDPALSDLTMAGQVKIEGNRTSETISAGAQSRRGAGRYATRSKPGPDIDSPLNWIGSHFSLLRSGSRSRRAKHIGRMAARLARIWQRLDDAALAEKRAPLSFALCARTVPDRILIAALSLASEYARRSLGMAPFSTQLGCAAALFRGAVAEMETGEGKTLAAFLAASVYALAGRTVHVVTANDYLARRDGEELRPAYSAMGLTLGIVVGGDQPEARRTAYAADIVYVTSKEVVFDYLRDRLGRSDRVRNPNLAAKLSRVFPVELAGSQPLQRPPDVAIIDEIDSVLIDEAMTPLLISAQRPGEISEAVARQALSIASAFVPGQDFAFDAFALMPSLTKAGFMRLAEETAGLDGPWGVRLMREELIRAAIASQHLLKRDLHYLVRDGKIILIDQQSGRVTPDRHWNQGLNLMIEVKEGCTTTGEKKSLASISFQRYFRTYPTICGMSGTVREVARELHSVYGLKATWISRRLPLRRKIEPRRILPDRATLWRSVGEFARQLQTRGQPGLIAVRSVGEAELASEALTRAGVSHRVLSAARAEAEAEIVAEAGLRGAMTVVTNMAGRGTDIRLGRDVAALGGLAVLVCERHDSARVDRQLIGRCSRQGDPGLVVEFVTPEDGLLAGLSASWHHFIRLWPAAIGLALARAQRLADRRGMASRLQLLRRDEQITRLMAFAGGLD